ncbi:hypothetical protein ONZ43_g7774 [Nemania bipapillata]|uniref:Uncharacterized protein n=1 Tax=Nemania bipapillata TaxID=110536 RepID=A0ACC2HPZ6_9PEZI|nr:hypothetical protein ONZ43_g7774 [Nemania bipapillata]
MVWISSLAAFGLSLFASFPFATALPSELPDGLYPGTRAAVSTYQIQRELGVLLSAGSSIFGSNTTGYANLTSRYQEYMPPHPELVVQVGREKDVSTIIKYANRNSIPFFVLNRRHGLPVSQGSFTGIQIDMTLLMSITISKDKKSALFQGGTYDQQVIDYLWDRGYVTTTGSCACVGMLGPGLGGGHGRLQGRYGLISDNMRNLNVVLADGTVTTVSNTSHSDLFWAMQGAGHNFAAVTSFELNIYPRRVDTWYHKNYVFRQDQLEELFEQLNIVDGNGTQPADLMNHGFFYMDSNFSTTEPVIWWEFSYAGPQSEAEKYLLPFDKIGPINVTDGNIPYPQILHATMTGLDDPLCAHGINHVVGTAGTQVYNVTTQRQVMDLFIDTVAKVPGLAGTFVVMEAYGVEGVVSKDPKNSAFPLRDDYLLLQISVNYLPDPSLDAAALEWVDQCVELWNQGQPTRRPTTPGAWTGYGA